MADAGNMWIVIVAMHVTADTHDQQCHLLIAVKELALCAVFDRIRVDGACIDLLDGALKDIIAFLQAALIRAENTLIFAGKGIAEAILQDGAGAHNDRRLAEIFEHGQKLFLDAWHEGPVEQQLADRFRVFEVIRRLDHPDAGGPQPVLNAVCIKDVGADVIGIMRLDARPIQLRCFIAQDVACQQHAGRLAADAARADLAVLDVQQVAHGEIFPAQRKTRRLITEQATQDILLEPLSILVCRLPAVRDRIKHAVPAVAPLAGLGKAFKNRISICAGCQRAPPGSGDFQREVRRWRAAATYFDRMDINTAVKRADIGKQRRLFPDARNGLIGVLFIIDRLICDRLTPDQEGIDEQKKVRDHQIGKPVFLQIRQTVEHKKRAKRLLVNDAVHLHGKGLKAHTRIKLVFFNVGATLTQRRCVHDLLMIGKAYIDDAVALPGNIGHKSRCDIHIVADMLALPDDRIARTKKIDRLVKTVNAGTDAAFIIHRFHTSAPLFHKKIGCA